MNVARHIPTQFALLPLVVFLVGCEPTPPEGGPTNMSEMAALMDRQEPPSETAAAVAPTPPPPPVVEEPQVVTSKTPKRGRLLHDRGSYLSAVGSARFTAEHQTILNNVRHALDLYRAEHGEFPKSHEEFMTRIIEANSIVLPELEEGYEYWYDPSERDPQNMLKFRPIQEDAAE